MVKYFGRSMKSEHAQFKDSGLSDFPAHSLCRQALHAVQWIQSASEWNSLTCREEEAHMKLNTHMYDQIFIQDLSPKIKYNPSHFL